VNASCRGESRARTTRSGNRARGRLDLRTPVRANFVGIPQKPELGGGSSVMTLFAREGHLGQAPPDEAGTAQRESVSPEASLRKLAKRGLMGRQRSGLRARKLAFASAIGGNRRGHRGKHFRDELRQPSSCARNLELRRQPAKPVGVRSHARTRATYSRTTSAKSVACIRGSPAKVYFGCTPPQANPIQVDFLSETLSSGGAVT
jgi:hypothetical protein